MLMCGFKLINTCSDFEQNTNKIHLMSRNAINFAWKEPSQGYHHSIMQSVMNVMAQDPVDVTSRVLIYPLCKVHCKEKCEIYCQQCNISLCVKCIVSGSHSGHEKTEILEIVNEKRNILKEKVKDIEIHTCQSYKNNISELEDNLAKLEESYDEIFCSISKNESAWHQVIEKVFHDTKLEVERMKIEDLEKINNHITEMRKQLLAAEQTIQEIRKDLEDNNISDIICKSKCAEIKTPNLKVFITFPSFSPLTIDSDHLYRMIGVVTASFISTPKTTDEPAAVLEKQLMESSEVITSINTVYKGSQTAVVPGLRNVRCLSPEEIWISGDDSKIKCLNIEGTVQKYLITANATAAPHGIAITQCGDLVFTEWDNQSINVVKNGKKENMIRLKDWKPYQLCVAVSGDLLVSMCKPCTPSRIVRFSGPTEKQIIQYNNKDEPLFSEDGGLFVVENSNKQTICASDCQAKAVLVVNSDGQLQFRYTGNLHSTSSKYSSFSPCGIATDTKNHILVADFDNHCVHIIDHDGLFLRYIGNCELQSPLDLSLDTNETLYVAEYKTSTVKIIKYLI